MKAARFVSKVERGLNEFRFHLKCEPYREIQKEDIGSRYLELQSSLRPRALDVRVVRMWYERK